MLKIDKNCTGFIDKIEFTALMAEVLSKRDQVEEMRKVFRCYDNDDDGKISHKNIWECAENLDMELHMDEENVEEMIGMGDRGQRGYVDLKDFISLMHKIGLINDESFT